MCIALDKIRYFWLSPEPNAIKIQGSVITGSCKYRKNLRDTVVFKKECNKTHFSCIDRKFPEYPKVKRNACE